MNAVSIVPGSGTALVAGRSAVLHAGEPHEERAAALLACDEVEAFVGSPQAPHDIAAGRWDGDRLEVWCRGEAAIAVGEQVFVGADELRHEVIDPRPPGHTHVTMWMGDGARPDQLERTPYRACAGVIPAQACGIVVAPDSVEVDPIDQLFGPTTPRDVEAAAVRSDVRSGPAPALAVMVFSTGERVVIDRTTVIGRRPTAVVETGAGEPGGPPQRLVALACPSVSRQHAIVRLDRWCATIEDLGSANGTTVSHGDDHPTALPLATPVDLMVGARVALGGDVSFVVEAIA